MTVGERFRQAESLRKNTTWKREQTEGQQQNVEPQSEKQAAKRREKLTGAKDKTKSKRRGSSVTETTKLKLREKAEIGKVQQGEYLKSRLYSVEAASQSLAAENQGLCELLEDEQAVSTGLKIELEQFAEKVRRLSEELANAKEAQQTIEDENKALLASVAPLISEKTSLLSRIDKLVADAMMAEERNLLKIEEARQLAEAESNGLREEAKREKEAKEEIWTRFKRLEDEVKVIRSEKANLQSEIERLTAEAKEVKRKFIDEQAHQNFPMPADEGTPITGNERNQVEVARSRQIIAEFEAALKLKLVVRIRICSVRKPIYFPVNNFVQLFAGSLDSLARINAVEKRVVSIPLGGNTLPIALSGEIAQPKKDKPSPESQKRAMEEVLGKKKDAARSSTAKPVSKTQIPSENHASSQKIFWKSTEEICEPSYLAVYWQDGGWIEKSQNSIFEMIGGECFGYCVIDKFPNRLFVRVKGTIDQAKKISKDSPISATFYSSVAQMNEGFGYSERVLQILSGI